jgi:hypothetical protein
MNLSKRAGGQEQRPRERQDRHQQQPAFAQALGHEREQRSTNEEDQRRM